MCRAEEVCTDDPVLRLGLGTNQLDVNGGCVGGKDAVWPAYLFQVCSASHMLIEDHCTDSLFQIKHDSNMESGPHNF